MAITREHISPRTAKFWIYGAVTISVLSALITAFMAAKGLLGIGKSAFLDAAITLGLAYGIARRSLTCTWIALGYYLLNRVYAYFSLGMVPTSRAITFVLFYSMAIICIGLYPAPRRSTGGPVAQDQTQGTSGGSGAV